MLKFHRDLAIDVGVDPNNILIMDNGDVAAISKEGIKKPVLFKLVMYILMVVVLEIFLIILFGNVAHLVRTDYLPRIITVDCQSRVIITDPIISRGFIYERK